VTKVLQHGERIGQHERVVVNREDYKRFVVLIRGAGRRGSDFLRCAGFSGRQQDFRDGAFTEAATQIEMTAELFGKAVHHWKSETGALLPSNHDGSSFPVEYWSNPIVRDGVHQGAVCSFIDITERTRAQEQQNLLLRELNHRIKNLFAITGGMIALSARSAKTPKDYAANLGGRLNALALAHDLILPAAPGEDGPKAESAKLDELLRKILLPYAGKSDSADSIRVTMHGPPVALGPQTVTTFALIIHELATNAVKYGSLSLEEGHLDITWGCIDKNLILTWEESGGPAIEGPPQAEGFGTALSNHSASAQLGGSLTNEWKRTGLTVELSVPLERLRQ
jgi:two-component sensor histidine kinase